MLPIYNDKMTGIVTLCQYLEKRRKKHSTKYGITSKKLNRIVDARIKISSCKKYY